MTQRVVSAICLALVVSGTLWPRPATADRLSPPIARAGSSCTFGPYRFSAIGVVLPYRIGEADIPGPHGNEVKQIYRVFVSYRAGNVLHTDFAGWLTVSFRNRYTFTPSGLVTSFKSLALVTLTVNPGDPERLPVGQWISRIVYIAHVVPDARMRGIEYGTESTTALSPCFAHDWDGRLGT